MNWLTENRLRSALLVITLGMTATFGAGLAADFMGFVFAVVLVAFQATALLHMPAKVKAANNDGEKLLYGSFIFAALLISVTASVATLSSTEDAALQAIRKQTTLQQAVDGYMEAGYVTKSLTTQKELDKLPVVTPTGLQSAALRLEMVISIDGMTIISGFIVMLALMLDSAVLMLDGKPQNKTTVDIFAGHEKSATNHAGSIASQPDLVQEQMDFGNSDFDISIEEKDGWPPEVRIVIKAHKTGKLPKITVKEVQQYLKCAQSKALVVARICKQEVLV